MSYHVDLKTQCFDSLSYPEACELEKIVEDLVLKGTPCMEHPAFVEWANALGYDDRQRFLSHAVHFPQRALLSLLRRERKISFE